MTVWMEARMHRRALTSEILPTTAACRRVVTVIISKSSVPHCSHAWIAGLVVSVPKSTAGRQTLFPSVTQDAGPLAGTAGGARHERG